MKACLGDNPQEGGLDRLPSFVFARNRDTKARENQNNTQSDRREENRAKEWSIEEADSFKDRKLDGGASSDEHDKISEYFALSHNLEW